MILNRTEAPAFKQVEHISFIRPELVELDNGIQAYVISAGEQELVRIEFIFNNTSWDPAKPLLQYAVNALLNDGTTKLSGAEIAGRIDYYGAFMQVEHSYDHSSLVLFSLNKHVDTLLPILREILTDSTFPEKELETFKRNQRQKLLVSLEKNDVLARRKFNEAVFGATSYGHAVTPANYDQLRRGDLLDYFRNAYTSSSFTLVVAGKVDKSVINSLNVHFGSLPPGKPFVQPGGFTFPSGSGETHYIERPAALQSALRIGKIAINRTHPDFPGLQVLNTILGGYFGSRLMTNIREDKGYTYGIGSGLASLKESGYFFIASEVGAEVCGAAIAEIEKEVNLLKNEAVPENELGLVKNYMMGSFLGDLENAFSHADKFKNIHFYGLGYDYYDRYIEVVKTITSAELQELAKTYLDFEGMEKVVVGKM